MYIVCIETLFNMQSNYDMKSNQEFKFSWTTVCICSDECSELMNLQIQRVI